MGKIEKMEARTAQGGSAALNVRRPLRPEWGHHGPSGPLHGRPARQAAAALRRHHDLPDAANGAG